MIDERNTAPVHPPDTVKPPVADPSLIIDSRYVLEERLGDGGMGVVYRARDRLLESYQDREPYLAVKVISDAMRNDQRLRMLLQRECRRVQKLAHPNIIRVYHFGRDEQTDRDYITMELLQGQPLERLIGSHAAGLSWERSEPLIEQLCSGLEYAHAERIVHSDIKPGNLFVTHAQTLKILDFGIAAPLRRSETHATETLLNPRLLGAVSERYSSLEMHLGLDADPSDDVYSAACVIYELLTGHHPFAGLPTPQSAAQHMVPAPITGLTRTQNRALRKALAFLRDERTGTIAELAEGLRRPRTTISRWHVWSAGAAACAIAGGSFWLISSHRHQAVHPVAASGQPAALIASNHVAPETQTRSVASLRATAASTDHGPTTDAGSAAVSTTGPAPMNGSGPATRPPIAANTAPATDPAPSRAMAIAPVTARETDSGSTSALTPKKASVSDKKSATAKLPDRTRESDQKCASIEEHIQLGETLNEEEQTYLRQHCR
jgi:serine/threonine protein kinase